MSAGSGVVGAGVGVGVGSTDAVVWGLVVTPALGVVPDAVGVTLGVVVEAQPRKKGDDKQG